MMVFLLIVLCYNTLLSNEFHCVLGSMLCVPYCASCTGDVHTGGNCSKSKGEGWRRAQVFCASQQSDPGAPTYLPVNRVPLVTSISWLTYQSDPGGPTYLPVNRVTFRVNRVTLRVNRVAPWCQHISKEGQWNSEPYHLSFVAEGLQKCKWRFADYVLASRWTTSWSVL